MLVNGYTKIHKEFEEKLSTTNGFEDAILIGSGYLANIALVEALVRKQKIKFSLMRSFTQAVSWHQN